jgi:hypothetical protein
MRALLCTGLLGLAAVVGLAMSAAPALASDWSCYGGNYGYGYGGGYVERQSYYRSYPAYRYDDCDRGYYGGGARYGVSFGVAPRYSHYGSYGHRDYYRGDFGHGRHHHHHHHHHHRGHRHGW